MKGWFARIRQYGPADNTDHSSHAQVTLNTISRVLGCSCGHLFSESSRQEVIQTKLS